MLVLYTKPSLKDLSQGARISYVRQIRIMSQDEVSEKLGLVGECKRRTMTRYERGDRFAGIARTKELAKILQVNFNAIRQYQFRDNSDLIYILLWLDELISNFTIEIPVRHDYQDIEINKIKKFLEEL